MLRISFKNLSTAPLDEDAEVAASWALFRDLKQKGQGHQQPDPRLLAELPMTKAVVRAFDVLQSFYQLQNHSRNNLALSEALTSHGDPQLQNFALMGTSKRGNLCYHVAAVDRRVGAIVPFVKALGLRAFLKRTRQSLGGIPFAATDYVNRRLFTDFLSSPQGSLFLNITDAISYVKLFKGLPKLIVNAGNDDFFIPDHTRLWWPSLPNPKWNLMLPNSGHIVGGSAVLQVAPAIGVFLSGVMSNKTNLLPKLNWTIDATGAITAELHDSTSKPTLVMLWEAMTCDARRRDFRLHNLDQGEECARCGKPTKNGVCENQAVRWKSSDLPETVPGSRRWQAQVKAPEDGRWKAFFIGFLFGGELNGLTLTTEVSVVPNTFPFHAPFPKCGVPGCDHSKLVL